MFRKLDIKMVALMVLMILALMMITYFLMNTANVFASNEIGEFIGSCASSCTTTG